MPARTVEAIVLRGWDLAENDRVLSVFTRDFGKIRGIAAGCKRVKEGNMAWQDLGAHVSLHLYEREGAELARFSRWRLLDHFPQTRTLKNLLHHIYIVDLLNEFTTEHNPNPGIFRLAAATLPAMGKRPMAEALTRYFEYWILRLEGIWPNLRHCASCRRSLTAQSVAFSFSPSRFVCRSCAPPGALLLNTQDIDVFDRFSRQSPTHLDPEGILLSTLLKMETISQILIRGHLEHDPKSYRLLKELAAA